MIITDREKLIRDLIAERIEQENQAPFKDTKMVIRYAAMEEMLALSRWKLFEEAFEFLSATNPEEQMKELADVSDGLTLVCAIHQFDPDVIRSLRREKWFAGEPGLVALQTSLVGASLAFVHETALDRLAGQLSDIYELFDLICATSKYFHADRLKKFSDDKREKNGWFDRRAVLVKSP